MSLNTLFLLGAVKEPSVPQFSRLVTRLSPHYRPLISLSLSRQLCSTVLITSSFSAWTYRSRLVTPSPPHLSLLLDRHIFFAFSCRYPLH